jgi:subtilase family serine protease
MQRQFNVRRTAISAVLAATFCAGAVLLPSSVQAGSAWADTATKVLPARLLAQATPLPSSTPLRIAVALKLQNKAELDSLAAAVNTPGNAQFGQFLGTAEFVQRFSPTAEQAQAVVDYLRGQGLGNVELADNRLLITAEGPAAVVGRAFNTQMVQFLSQGKLEYANASTAQVPSALGGLVAAVVGLQSTGRMHTNNVPMNPSPAQALPGVTLSYGAQDFQKVYDAGATASGQGTSVAVLSWGDASAVQADLRQYEKEYHLPQVPFEHIIVGAPGVDPSADIEWDLDTQVSGGIGADLRQMLLYSVYNGDDADITRGANQVVTENRVRAVNMSFGACEYQNFLDGSMITLDQAFEEGAVQGMAFFAASGDGGASCQFIANAGQPMLLGMVEYPASSNWVLSSGGTSLINNSDGSYNVETAWRDSGGGFSVFEFAQPWQTPVLPAINVLEGVVNPQQGLGFPARGVPDVAMNADDLISGTALVHHGSNTGVGGTSVASPLSMGVWARFQAAHGECFGIPQPLYYAQVPQTGAVASVIDQINAVLAVPQDTAIGSAPLQFGSGLGNPATGMHDITVGFNFLYPATPGWDFVTGLGSFDISAVSTELPKLSCAPEVPFSTTAGLISGTVMLNWKLSPGATSYAVYAGNTPGGEGAKPIASSSNTNTLIKGLAGGKTWYFKVKAVNAKGSSAASNEVGVAIPLPPPAPASLVATAGTGKVGLSWKAAAGATSYQVFQGTAAGAESTVPVQTVSGTTATVGSLKKGTTYYYVVRAANSGGDGAKSNEAHAVPN